MTAIRYFVSVLAALIVLWSPLRAGDHAWSEPVLLVAGPSNTITRISNLYLSQDGFLHIAWLATNNDTIAYFSFKDDNFSRPIFRLPVRRLRAFYPLSVIVDDDNLAHLFWIESGYRQDSTYFEKMVHLELPLFADAPYYGQWRVDTLRLALPSYGIIDFSVCLSNKGALYLCWEEPHTMVTLFLLSKPRGQSNWIIPAGPLFQNFVMENGGSAGNPYLVSGIFHDLYLTFIGHKDSDTIGGPQFMYLNFVYYAEKPLNTGRWHEPVLVHKDFACPAMFPIIMTDQQQVRHILWLKLWDPHKSLVDSRLFYSFSRDGQHWSNARLLTDWISWFDQPTMVIDRHDIVHVFWSQFYSVEGHSEGIYYCYGREDAWSEPSLAFDYQIGKSYSIRNNPVLDDNDRLHLVRMTSYLNPDGKVYWRELEYLWRDLNPTMVAEHLGYEAGADQQALVIKSYPNPFNKTVTLVVVPQKECDVSLSIYNIAGQCVRKLWEERTISSELSYQWDGTADTGTPLPSGIYYLLAKGRANTNSEPFQLCHKLVLIK